MNPLGDRILEHLRAVESERAARAGDPVLDERVQAVKAYQQHRFRRGYADLLQHPRYGPAAQFFLEELYGPGDFSDRDAQFARIVPALVSLFPHEIVETVARLAALHAISERLDTQMGRHVTALPIHAADYVSAWQAVGQADARREQIQLTLEVGHALERYTRNPVLRHSLRLMRGPARAAGLAALQSFLERGFDTFRAMRGAEGFLATVQAREEALRQRLFATEAVACATKISAACPTGDDPLGQLP
ncbi:MAG: hypothetical protein AB1430_01325 [Pseudomonadota bacterium]